MADRARSDAIRAQRIRGCDENGVSSRRARGAARVDVRESVGGSADGRRAAEPDERRRGDDGIRGRLDPNRGDDGGQVDDRGHRGRQPRGRDQLADRAVIVVGRDRGVVGRPLGRGRTVVMATRAERSRLDLRRPARPAVLPVLVHVDRPHETRKQQVRNEGEGKEFARMRHVERQRSRISPWVDLDRLASARPPRFAREAKTSSVLRGEHSPYRVRRSHGRRWTTSMNGTQLVGRRPHPASQTRRRTNTVSSVSSRIAIGSSTS